jgi:hypothetical protein
VLFNLVLTWEVLRGRLVSLVSMVLCLEGLEATFMSFVFYYSLRPKISDVNLSRFICIHLLKYIYIHANLNESTSLISGQR